MTIAILRHPKHLIVVFVVVAAVVAVVVAVVVIVADTTAVVMVVVLILILIRHIAAPPLRACLTTRTCISLVSCYVILSHPSPACVTRCPHSSRWRNVDFQYRMGVYPDLTFCPTVPKIALCILVAAHIFYHL
jgi:hypothetical protein